MSGEPVMTPAPLGAPEGAQWLADAILYEIYPQSFADSNGDGIGDLPGALAHLDHVAWLGANTVWFNPCFASPFVDAGYDVSDYVRVAPRYGTNDDLVAFVDAAAARGIRVLLDLVAGHTSVQHPWFRRELADPDPDPDGERYIWSELPGRERLIPGVPDGSPWVASPGPRPGYYLKNFYDAQPALNFGYARAVDGEPWRQSVDAAGPRRNRQALRDIMSFWLDKGVAGFRVDMAFSLVKDDVDLRETSLLWHELHTWLSRVYPTAVLIPEGVEPHNGIEPSFDADFFLVIEAAHSSLFNNGGAGRLFSVPPAPCFFDGDGLGSTDTFLAAWRAARAGRPDRAVILASADHDFSRLACGERDEEQLGAAFAFLLTWGSVPSIYYGDEIGLRYQPDLPAKEGSICHPGYYNRAGARTPMHWDSGINAGFSTASPDALYLPVDPSGRRATVSGQRSDPNSVLSLVRRLIQLRVANPALGGRGEPAVLHSGYPFVYRRGDSYLVVVNPRRASATAHLNDVGPAAALLAAGVEVRADRVQAEGFGYGIFRLTAPEQPAPVGHDAARTGGT